MTRAGLKKACVGPMSSARRSASRDVRLYLEDIEQACEKIEPFTTGMPLASFVADERTYDAVLRKLEVLGEATKRVPDALKAEMPDVPWRAIAEFRDSSTESLRLPSRSAWLRAR